jgi:hypothetical protein
MDFGASPTEWWTNSGLSLNSHWMPDGVSLERWSRVWTQYSRLLFPPKDQPAKTQVLAGLMTGSQPPRTAPAARTDRPAAHHYEVYQQACAKVRSHNEADGYGGFSRGRR